MNWLFAPKISPSIRSKLSNYPSQIAQLLYNRGIKSEASAKQFFHPSGEHIHSFQLLSDIDQAIDTIIQHIDKKSKIYIYGDYDVDGISSTSILFDFLYRKLKADVLPYIPSRFDEGYGLNRQALDHILDEKGNLVITVDCGIRDKEIVEEYSQKGLDFIITDHHSIRIENGQEILPDSAKAIVHPAIINSKYPFPQICAANVAYKLVLALANKQKIELDEYEYLDLVAMATVCDVMPLIDENRAIVFFGLERMKSSSNLGLKVLIDEIGIDLKQLKAYHIAFAIGPRLNASGRLEHAIDGVRLLTTSNKQTAEKLAKKLNELNSQRQQLTSEMLEQSLHMIGDLDNSQKLIFLIGEDWAEGVVGLIAGKLTEKYHRPTLIGSLKNGIVKGSARSIKGFNITEAISLSGEYFIKYGGHDQAAGFSFEYKNAKYLQTQLLSHANSNITDMQLEGSMLIDATTALEDLDVSIIKWIEKMEPYGYHNTTPVFAIENLTITAVRAVGRDNAHLKFTLSDGANFIGAIWFGNGSKIEEFNISDIISVACSISIDEWNSKPKLQLLIKDVRFND